MPMPWLQASETSRRPADWAFTPTIRSRPCSARELSKLELEADAADIDTLLVAVSGGGLIGGIAAWYASRAKIVAVESDGAPTLHSAFKAGGPIDALTGGIAADSRPRSASGSSPSQLPDNTWLRRWSWPVMQRSSVRNAVLWDRVRIVAEPGGAAALAAVISGRYRPAFGERVAVLVCGANTTAVDFSN